MDAIIERILEIDHNAKNIVGDAAKKNADSDEIIAVEKENLKKRITEEAAHKTESVRQNMIARAQREAESHEADAAEKIAQMETRAAAYTDQWVEELYRHITEEGS